MGAILTLLFIAIIRKKRKFVKSAITLLLIFSNGVFSGLLWIFLEQPWKRLEPNSMDFVDGIVVLSMGRKLPPGKTKIIEWRDPDRFFAGLELYKAKRSNKLIFTGGIIPYEPNLPPEGDIYIKEAISLGVSEQSLFTTGSVLNTFQEAKEIKKLLNKGSNTSRNTIILVTSAYHMKRAKRVFEREGIIVKPYPVDFKSNKFNTLLKNPLKWIPSAESFFASSTAIREILGRIIYRSLY